MDTPLTYTELASMMKRCAGLAVDPMQLELRPDAPFADYGLDSLGLLGIVGALENDYGTSLPAGADTCKTPGQFLDVVNETLKAGA